MSRQHRRRLGFTLVELLVVIAIIGVLVSLLLLAIQQAREAARRAQCINNLKQLGVALHSYHESHNTFPPGYVSSASIASGCPTQTLQNNGAPWSVLILPFLDETARYDRFNFVENFTAINEFPAEGSRTSTNHVEWLKRLAKFQCPSDPATGRRFNNSNYLGVQGGGAGSLAACAVDGSRRFFFGNGILYHNSRTQFGSISDGSSKVFMLGETRYQPTLGHLPHGGFPEGYYVIGWASSGRFAGGASLPNSLAGAVLPINSIPGSGSEPQVSGYDHLFKYFSRVFGSFHPGGAHFLMADGSAFFVSESVDEDLYQTSSIRNDGLPLERFSN
ncbi:hypothetical protein Pan216_05720 [Planctomycetes bacterium Pan216]|uniref:DUF1559 domain-containing protein n=1 Tax=Kolteria novifilia TaxID=2527975 RepID=A0A518AYH1_9BACT|nr:hypothetical protein Pan216_05720 [Planctomycetes bacterium Pan216]